MSFTAEFSELRRSVAAIQPQGIDTDARSRADFLPPCPLCSHVGVEGRDNIITYPFAARLLRTRRYWLQGCCSIGIPSPSFDTPAELAQYWRTCREKPLRDVSLENRRRSTLGRLEQLGYEPVT